ncbi:primase-like DNA-binding domain-containing protein [Metasolibacillus meyeri]|uniref:primase-like DNA-binding domain-containing protein n=1 Tax=Metasolibacillus meyeri TaxID=1071052 RepID=UPI000D2FCD4D|nr:primase-like DNA-binding domain-containing protein [Metasolibacillus meyeri]
MIDEFVRENLTMTQDFIKMPAKEVYERYLKYCEIKKIEPLGVRKFYNNIEKYGISKSRGTGNTLSFKGVYLKKCPY